MERGRNIIVFQKSKSTGHQTVDSTLLNISNVLALPRVK
jgi:hypothetical protein